MQQSRPNIIWLILLVTCIPIVQQLFGIIKIYPLKGAFEIFEEPTLNDSTWFNKSFQSSYENYLNQNFGFRNIFVRLRNQLDWELYKKPNASVIVGKEDYLFERGYLNSYKGRDFIGEDEIHNRVKNIGKIKEFLQSKGIGLIVAIAPGKAWYYPEYIPDDFLPPNQDYTTNYQIFLRELRLQNISHIDFNSWFLKQKDSLGMLLYPKTGIHWSLLGAAQALDSIARYGEHYFNLTIPKYQLLETEKTQEKIRSTDNDLEKLLNLLFRYHEAPMTYPKLEVLSEDNPPRVLVVGDSFFGVVTNYAGEIFDYDFAYYNRTWQRVGGRETTRVRNIEALSKEYQLVILMASEAGLITFPWGFAEEMAAALDTIN